MNDPYRPDTRPLTKISISSQEGVPVTLEEPAWAASVQAANEAAREKLLAPKGVWGWVLTRSKEKSTWAGAASLIGLVATVFGFAVWPESDIEIVGIALASVGGIVAVAINERRLPVKLLQETIPSVIEAMGVVRRHRKQQPLRSSAQTEGE